jgi:hypothetical protein
MAEPPASTIPNGHSSLHKIDVIGGKRQQMYTGHSSISWATVTGFFSSFTCIYHIHTFTFRNSWFVYISRGCTWLLLHSNTSRWASTDHPRASISGISISSLLTASGPPGNLDIQSWIWMNLLVVPTRVRAKQILRSILSGASLDS